MFVRNTIHHSMRRSQPPVVLACLLLTAVLFVSGNVIAQSGNSSNFDATLSQARALLKSSVWYNRYDDALRDSVNLAIEAAQTAEAHWGQQDIRYRRAISVYALAMSQHTLGLISRAEADAVQSAQQVASMTSEAGSIAMNETRDGELAMMATLLRARLARVTGDEAASKETYDFVIQSLESMMATDHPILVAVKAERG